MRTIQDTHWWYRGRKEIIELVFRLYISSKNNSIIDIGGGYGSNIDVLQRFGNVDVIEPHKGAAEVLLGKGVNTVYQIKQIEDYKNVNKKYHIATMFDVLEHIKDDTELLSYINNKMLMNKGYMFITVPAYNWLWSEHDTVHGHYRRYTKTTLRTVLEKAGLDVLELRYFMFLLFPIAAIVRILQKYSPICANEANKSNNVINEILFRIFRLESTLLKKFRMPFGLSILAVVQQSDYGKN